MILYCYIGKRDDVNRSSISIVYIKIANKSLHFLNFVVKYSIYENCTLWRRYGIKKYLQTI